MHRSVATFWWTLEDEAEFFSHLDSLGPVVAFTMPWKKTPQEVIAWDIRTLIAAEHPTRLMFGLRRMHDPIPTVSREFPRSGVLYNVDPSTGCLLMYDPVRFRDSKMERCNLAAYWDAFDIENQATTPKNAEFTVWGKKVFAWLRRRTKGKSGFYRISDQAVLAVEEQKLTLA